MSVEAYPLYWPQAFPRAKAREKGAFRTTLPAALKNVQRSLELFASDSGKRLDNVVISSNVTLGKERPTDPGVAIWFVWDGLSLSIAVDRYATVEANLQAIHHIIEARRVELRHGTLALVRATFQGFTALPSPRGARSCWDVLGIEPGASSAAIKGAWRAKAQRLHPDAGGSDAAMAELNRAKDEALRLVGAP